MIDDQPLLIEYLSESEQLIESLLADLDALSSQVARAKSPKPPANLVNRVFRTVHSLKGLAGMMGLPEVQSLAHEFEDALDDLRLGRLALDTRSAAVLQEAGAGLAALVATAARGQATEDDFRRFQELIGSIAARQERAKEDARAAALLGFSDKEQSLLTEFEEHRIEVNLEAGSSFYSLEVQFPSSGLDARYRSLAGRLDELGELITTLPATAPGDRVGLKLVFATQLKEAEVRAALTGPGVRLEKMGRSAWRRAGEALRKPLRGRAAPRPGRPAKPGPGSSQASYAALPASFARESLQALLPSVRVDLSQIDEISGLAHELSIQTRRLSDMAGRLMAAADCGAKERFELKQSVRRLEREFVELEERLVELRMVSLAQTFERAARLARRLARELGKSVTVELSGRSTQLDKTIVDRIADPIHHILRNAIDHGIEMPGVRRLAGKPARGQIKLEASLEGTRAVIAISDDGRGIDPEQVRARALQIGAITSDEKLSEEETLQLIFRPGFSTAGEVSAVSGRGVGLDAVERTVSELGGEVRVLSEIGRGCRFELAVPTTLQMISAFIVRVGEWKYAINVGQIVELLYYSPADLEGGSAKRGQPTKGARSLRWGGRRVPLVELRHLVGVEDASPVERQPDRTPALITRVSDRTVAVEVDGFEGQREIIVKSLGSVGRRLQGVVGAVDLETGDVALVVDLPGLLVLRNIRLTNGRR